MPVYPGALSLAKIHPMRIKPLFSIRIGDEGHRLSEI
jgi:hypothetical protein